MPTLDEIKQYVTPERVQDIIDTASEGGITYWATEPTDQEFAGMPAGKQYTIVEGQSEDPRFGDEREVESVNYLAVEDIQKAYAKLLDLDQDYVNRRYHGYLIESWIERSERGGIETGNIDAGTADVIVQVAIFDEVMYG